MTFKITQIVVRDGFIREEISLMYAVSVSQPVLYEVLNAVSDDVFKRKCFFNGELMTNVVSFNI